LKKENQESKVYTIAMMDCRHIWGGGKEKKKDFEL
jgi:hypothetical protein